MTLSPSGADLAEKATLVALVACGAADLFDRQQDGVAGRSPRRRPGPAAHCRSPRPCATAACGCGCSRRPGRWPGSRRSSRRSCRPASGLRPSGRPGRWPATSPSPREKSGPVGRFGVISSASGGAVQISSITAPLRRRKGVRATFSGRRQQRRQDRADPYGRRKTTVFTLAIAVVAGRSDSYYQRNSSSPLRKGKHLWNARLQCFCPSKTPKPPWPTLWRRSWTWPPS